MIKENAVAGEDVVGLSIILCLIKAIDFSTRIGTARMKRSCFTLRNLMNFTVHFTRRGLIQTNIFVLAYLADGFQQSKRSERADVYGVKWLIE